MRRKRPAGAFAHVVGRLPGARRPTPWRPLLALLATFQASGVPGCARRQRSRRSSRPEIGADRRERRRPGANGCARRARLPTIHASRLRRLPTIQILQIIHGATYVCARLRTSAAFQAAELSGDRRRSAECRRPGANGCGLLQRNDKRDKQKNGGDDVGDDIPPVPGTDAARRVASGTPGEKPEKIVSIAHREDITKSAAERQACLNFFSNTPLRTVGGIWYHSCAGSAGAGPRHPTMAREQ